MSELSYRHLLEIQDRYPVSVVGVDEVGRGALAGPILVAAISLHKQILNIADSKLLTPAARKELSRQISQSARITRLGWATPDEIDTYGLVKAQALAYERVLNGIPQECLILTDNVSIPDRPFIRAVQGDTLFYPVSAASIVAKTIRDQLMAVYDTFFPHYSWKDNVGYGTLAHTSALKKYGPTPLHRKSFLHLRGDKRQKI